MKNIKLLTLLSLIPLVASCSGQAASLESFKAKAEDLSNAPLYPYYRVQGMMDFNAEVMEVDYDENLEEDAIIAILKDGYMYKDRVLVPTMVKVNKKPVEDAKEDNKESEEN